MIVERQSGAWSWSVIYVTLNNLDFTLWVVVSQWMFFFPASGIYLALNIYEHLMSCIHYVYVFCFPKDAKFCNVRDLRINVIHIVSIQGAWGRDIIFITFYVSISVGCFCTWKHHSLQQTKIAVSEMSRLRPREVKELAQDHTLNK